MTVATTHNTQEFDGNDSAVVFPFIFPFFNDSEIFVYLTDIDGNQALINQLSDYTITAPSKRSGGQINYPVTGDLLSNGEKLLVVRTLPVDQTASIRNQGRFNASVHETVFDKITMILQQFFSFFERTYVRRSGDTMDNPLAGPNSEKSDDYMPQLQIVNTIDERMSSAPEFDPNNFQDYGLVTQAVNNSNDYGSI